MSKKNIAALFFSMFCLFFDVRFSVAGQHGAKPEFEEPLAVLKNEALSYFQPVTGKIISVDGSAVKIDIGSGMAVKAGMRLNVFREGAGFVHPVTKETLGRIEMPVGYIDITKSEKNGPEAVIVSGKYEDFANAKVKMPGTRVKVLFCQGNVDWYIGDTYYQLLKESGRFELIDTGIDTVDIPKIVSEAKAKGADVALVLDSGEAEGRLELRQKLLWVRDSKEFSARKVLIDAARMKELKFKSGFFGPREGEVLLSFQLTSGAQRLAAGDLDGDGNPDIIIVAGDMIRVYKPGTDLQLQWEFRVPAAAEVLWIDRADIDKNGRDELYITSIEGDDVASYVYELKDSGFVQLWKAKDVFIRRLGNEIAGQKYNKGDGYFESPYIMTFADGAYKKGASLKLPQDVNIYDFQYVGSPDGRRAVLAWDESGFLNLYDEKGIRTWRSAEDYGGFATTFKRDAPTIMVDRGTWSVKDRLIAKDHEVLMPKRKPLVGMARGLGYKASEVRSVWWNGIGVEERVFIDEMGGGILDYALVGDRVIVLAKPLFGIRAKNILNFENPLGVMLHIFSLKGR